MTPLGTEASRVQELLRLLETVRCIDSTLFIEVDEHTFEVFSGDVAVVANDSGQPDFRSKNVLTIQNDPRVPGFGVEVVLWAAARRRLEVA